MRSDSQRPDLGTTAPQQRQMSSFLNSPPCPLNDDAQLGGVNGLPMRRNRSTSLWGQPTRRLGGYWAPGRATVCQPPLADEVEVVFVSGGAEAK
jgi:hypothetical protein